MKIKETKNWGPKFPVKWVVRAELSSPFSGDTLLGQGHGLEIKKYWSPGELAGMAWGSRVSRPVAPGHKPSSPFSSVCSNVQKIGKQCMRVW